MKAIPAATFALALSFSAIFAAAHLWGLAGVAMAILLHKALQLLWSTSVVWRLLRRAEAETPS